MTIPETDISAHLALSCEAAPEVVITVRDLGKAYRLHGRPSRGGRSFFGRRSGEDDRFWALKGLDFELRRGQTVGILGVNGAGKSTLLQLICGISRPTTGYAKVSGRIAALLSLGAGFHPQFTGRENVRLKASALGLSKQEIDRRFDSIADFADIGEFMELPVKLYSSGMYARLAFAVCANVDADILIIDEILSVGDGVFAQKCQRFLNRFREHGTVLFVSHNSGMVATLCDEALWLEHGRLREFGPAAEVSRRYLSSLSEADGSRPEICSDHSADRWWAPPPPPLVSDLRPRNSKMRVSDFDPVAPWHGSGGLLVEGVGFHTPDGLPLIEMCGGDEVELRISARAERDVAQPILGFILRDRFGQNVFGDNTFVTYRHTPLAVSSGEEIQGKFRFQLPYLARGDYSLTVAFVDGTQDDHTHLQWIEDALIVSVLESPVNCGIVALPAKDIRMNVSPPYDSIKST